MVLTKTTASVVGVKRPYSAIVARDLEPDNDAEAERPLSADGAGSRTTSRRQSPNSRLSYGHLPESMHLPLSRYYGSIVYLLSFLFNERSILTSWIPHSHAAAFQKFYAAKKIEQILL